MPSVLRSAVLLARHALVALAVLAVLASAFGLHPHIACPDHGQDAAGACALDPAAPDGHDDQGDGDPSDPACNHCHCPPATPLMAPDAEHLPQGMWQALRLRPLSERIPASAVHQPDPPPARA